MEYKLFRNTSIINIAVKHNLKLGSINSRYLASTTKLAKSKPVKPIIDRNYNTQAHRPRYAKYNHSLFNIPVDRSVDEEHKTKVHKHSLQDLDEALGPEQANDIRADLTENEMCGTIYQKNSRARKYKGVAKFYSNYISANTPSEDRRIGLRNSISKKNSRTRLKGATEEESYIFGVLDGHGGGLNADVVARRLGDYFMTTQVPNEEISNYLSNSHNQVSNATFSAQILPYRTRNLFIDKVLSERAFTGRGWNFKAQDFWPVWRHSNNEFSRSILEGEIKVDNALDAMRNAIIRLDQDIADEALKYGSPSSLHYNKKNAEMYRKIAANGCVGSVAVIKQGILTLAHVGDTRVLIGKKSPEYDGWQSERLTPEHTLDNKEELDKLLKDHPGEEKSVIERNRVLGILQPTRAFGDHKLKQSHQWLEEVYQDDDTFSPYADYNTPPYVTVEPFMTRVALSKERKFMVMASDGFWEMFEKADLTSDLDNYDDTPSLDEIASKREKQKRNENKIIEMIGEHIENVKTIDGLSEARKQMYKNHYGYENNIATQIVKRALMMNEFGDEDKMNLADMLTLRANERRSKRDDITIVIVVFEED